MTARRLHHDTVSLARFGGDVEASEVVLAIVMFLFFLAG